MIKQNLDELNDAEIQKMLLRYGLPNLPVTETTRSVLVKKLKNVCKVNSNSHMEADRLSRTIGPPRTCLKEKKINRTKVSNGNRNLDVKHLYGMNIEKERLHSNLSKMYTPPPILASESEEDSDYVSACGSSSSKESHYLNQSACKNMKKRLLSFRDLTLQPRSQSYKMCAPNDSEVFYQMPKEGTKNKRSLVPKLADTMLYLGLQPGCTQNLVPYLLVSAFAIFFMFLIFMYMIITPNSFEICESNTHFVLCDESNPMPVPSGTPVNCIESNHLELAIIFSKKLMQLLQLRARKHYCEGHHHPALISASDFAIHLYEEKCVKEAREIMQGLQSAEHLIRRNPQWKVAVKQLNESSAILANNFVPTNETQFILLKPKLPFMCTFYKKILNFFIIIGTGGVIAISLFTCYLAYQYIRTWQKSRRTTVDKYLTDIVGELMYRASSGEPDVIINHLRDKVMPLNKRSTHLWAWNEALRILECSESRILFGSNFLNGEEFRTMRWTGNKHLPVSRDCSVAKHWQSPAFGNSNKVTCPPTSCLKIRHMFESSEANHNNLKEIIKEAIIEKVGARCTIQDIQIDKHSCCVYVRCANEAHAGVIHNEINGWWFDNRLVSIKFLRLQRYLSRFPNKPNETLCDDNDAAT